MNASFSRLRRYRHTPTIRALVEDCSLSAKDLILPIFIQEKEGTSEIPQMPYALRYGPQALLAHLEHCSAKGILAIALFPLIDESKKTDCAQEAWNPQGLVPSTIRQIKKYFPQTAIIADLALDPFHPNGQDGLCSNEGEVLNDPTVLALCKQALCYAEAGADILAPSDMMDGRILGIRNALETHGYIHTLILSYSIKFASHLYGPFRHAVDSSRFLGKSDKKTYQMDFKSHFQTTLEAQADITEGADFLMVKPALHYLDVIAHIHQSFPSYPVWAYHVSGECSLLWYGAANGLFNFDMMLLETLWAMRRAGSAKILTYFACEAATIL